jgi:very-short-patch-repair endonuclease
VLSARVSDLPQSDIATIRGWPPVTTVVRTLRDLGTILGIDEVERALESALRRRLVSVTEVSAIAGHAGGRRGVPVLRRVLSRRPADAPATESDVETRFLQLCRRGGIDEPVRQYPQLVGGQRVRFDFAWPRPRIAAEIDGAATHAGDALGPDLRRQNRIVLGAWIVIRFTWEDVVRYPDYTLSVVRDAHRLGLAARVRV